MTAQIISFNCVLKNQLGQLISTTYNRDVLTAVENADTLLHGLSEAMQNVKAGEKRTIALTAKDAYGPCDPNKIILFPRSRLPEKIPNGGSVSVSGKSGRVRWYRFIETRGDMAILDGNHPLAGQDPVFGVEILSARAATSNELETSINPMSGQLLH